MKKLKLLGLFLVAFIPILQAQSVNVFQGKAIGEQTLYGSDIMPYFVKADNLMLSGSYEQAIITLDNVVAEYPQFAEGYMKRAMALYRLGRLDEAQNDYQTAIRFNPYIADLYGYNHDLGKLKILAFNAVDFIENPSLSYRIDYYFLELFFNEEQLSLENMERFEMALNSMEQKDFTRALIYLVDITNELEDNVMAYNLMGIVYEYDEQYDLAIDALEKALTIDENYAMTYFNMSMVHTNQYAYTSALENINKAIELDPEMLKAYFHRAVLYKKIGQPSKAIAEYDDLQDKQEIITHEVYLNRAISKKVLGDMMGASQDINEAIALSPRNAVLYKIRGNIKVLQRNYDDAINDFTRAIELDQNFAEAYFNRGIAQLLTSNRAEACKDLESSISLGYIEGVEKTSYFCSF